MYKQLAVSLKAVSLATLFVASFSGVVHAEKNYLGLGLGQASSTIDEDGIRLISGPLISSDDKDSSFKFFYGHQVSEVIALEFGYTDLGNVSATESSLGIVDTYEFEVSGISLSALGKLPVSDRVDLFGRIGVFLWDSDFTVCLPSASGCIGGSDDGSDLLYGFGIDFKINDKIRLRGEYEMLDVDVVKAGAGEFSVLSGNLVFDF